MIGTSRIALAAALWLALGAAAAQAERLVFGVVPQQSASRLAAMWGPFLDAVSARSGHEIAFATAKDIPTFEACLQRGAYDIAYMNPKHYVVYNARAGYTAFARRAGFHLRGILVVRRDAAITGLADLDGATLAFPGPGSFGASILTQATLDDAGVRYTPRYVSSHDSVYRAVAAGLAPAGGGVTGTLRTAPAEIRDQLRVLYETPAFSPHAFAARPGLGAEVTDALTAAMQAVAAETPELAKAAGFPGFEAAGDADYADIRGLGLSDAAVTTQVDANPPCRSD